LIKQYESGIDEELLRHANNLREKLIGIDNTSESFLKQIEKIHLNAKLWQMRLWSDVAPQADTAHDTIPHQGYQGANHAEPEGESEDDEEYFDVFNNRWNWSKAIPSVSSITSFKRSCQ